MKANYYVLLKLVLTLTLLTLSAHLLFSHFGEVYYPRYLVIIPLYFLFEGFVLFAVVGEAEKKKEIPSPQKQLLLRTVKMFTCVIALIVGLLLDREHAAGFSLSFAVFYVIYLIFETVEMVKLKRYQTQ